MFDCLRRENNLETPKPKFLKVIIRFGTNPLIDCCSSTEQQLSIFALRLYLPNMVIKVANPAAAYPIIYPKTIPCKL